MQRLNIAVVSDDEERIDIFRNILSDHSQKISAFSFEKALQNFESGELFDLFIIDFVSQTPMNLEMPEQLRRHKKIESIPFIMVLKHDQESLKRKSYKQPNTLMLLEPVDRFALISLVNSAVHQTEIERRLLVYRDLVEGEKKLISYLDELLELEGIFELDDQESVLDKIKGPFLRRLELILAVETAFYAEYDNHGPSLRLHSPLARNKKSDQPSDYVLTDDLILWIINSNQARIISQNNLNDPFIRRLQDNLGYKINCLLIIPVSVFHQPRAVILLVNKLYRDNFIENDLAFSVMASHKITFHLEKIYLKTVSEEAVLSDQGKGSLLNYIENIRSEWRMYRQVMDSVNFGTVVIDGQDRIMYLNDPALKILKHDATSAPGKLNDLFENEELKQIKETIAANSLPLVRQEVQIKRNIYPHFYIGFSVYPFKESGKDWLIIIFSEISRTKRIQAEIIRMDRMASLGILSSGIAHEIRNPLAGIKAMAQSLQDEIGRNSAHIEYIQRILRQVNRLDDLLRAFFSYAKPIRPEPTVCKIHKIIQEVIPLIKRKLIDLDISIDEDYAEDLFDVFVDSNQIEQVFLNLFINALDAMQNGGKLSISAKNAGVEELVLDRRNLVPDMQARHYVQITVSDNGCGIAEDVLDNIFDPFFTTKSHGTGLGLSIIYQIIREHSGQIEVESKAGQGSAFIIFLPVHEQQDPDKAQTK